MKALILNSGTGSRMGDLTRTRPKCMTDLGCGETILSRQLQMLTDAGIKEFVITTGAFDAVIREAVAELKLDATFRFVLNPIASETNYIYSMALAAQDLKGDDILLLHGDLVFEWRTLERMLDCARDDTGGMAVSFIRPLPEKDFKAVWTQRDQERRIEKIGIEFFDHAVAAQPMYVLREKDMDIWMEAIVHFTAAGDTLTISVARGLGVYEHGMDFAAVSKNADAAMYNHKLAIKSKYGEEVR